MLQRMKQIETQQAPAAVGPYAQAVATDTLIFCSGQIPLMPDGTLVSGDITEQTEQVCKNVKAVLAAAGSSLSKVVKCEVYLKDMNDFTAMNTVYAQYFNGPVLPARVTVEVARLPKDVRVEISCVALTH
jgi:2-iminobutanoate/2-iminopropanoate deaminase